MLLNVPWLSLILFLPLLAGLIILCVPRGNARIVTGVALLGSLLTLCGAIIVYRLYQFDFRGFQFEERVPWIPSIGADYHIGVDGLSLGMVLLTTFLTPLVIAYVASRLQEDANSRLFTILALETCLLGVLLSLDMLLFYIFWEAMLIPMYFLISIWGGERRSHASLKFIVYMMVGSLLMLAGILWFYWWQHAHSPMGVFTFNFVDWVAVNGTIAARIPHTIQLWMFFFFFLSFAIKLPLFPFHTWLPDAQEAGPIEFNVLLIEVGAYAFVRFCLPLFPDATVTCAAPMMALAVINIIYASVLATVQRDLKRLFAYAAMAHAGFMILGIYSLTIQGITGGVLYMINSGLISAGLFFVADMLYRRRGSQQIADFGGLATPMPKLLFLFMVITLGAIGLPFLNSFVSEFLVMLGAIRSNVVSPVYGYLSGAGVVLSVVYMLWMFQRVMFGDPPDRLATAPDLDGHEQVILWPLVAVIIFLGIAAAYMTQPMRPASDRVVAAVQDGVRLTTLTPPDRDIVQEPASP